MRSCVYAYVLLALTSSLTLAAPLSVSERSFRPIVSVIPRDPPMAPDTLDPPPNTPTPPLGPLDGMGPGESPGKPAVERAEERREFSHVAGQSNEDVPTPPGPGAFRVKRVEARLRPVVGPDGTPALPDFDLPVAPPTSILDRDDQGGFPDVLGDLFKAHPNLVFDRGVGSFINKDYRRNYVDALHDLLG